MTALATSGLYEHPRDYDVAFFDTTDLEVDRLLTLIGRHAATPVGSILEAGCGTGRILRGLTHRGIRTGGYDLSPRMVAFAQARLMECDADEPLRVWRDDMARPRVVPRFDAAINVVNTLGYLHDDEALASHFHTMSRTVGRAGLYVLQLSYAWGDLNAAEVGHWRGARSGVSVEVTWSIVKEDPARRLSIQRSILRVSDFLGSYVLRDEHQLRLWFPDELASLAQSGGFDVVGSYTDALAPIPVDEVPTGEMGNIYVVLRNRAGE